jgi:hypothetical protein
MLIYLIKLIATLFYGYVKKNFDDNKISRRKNYNININNDVNNNNNNNNIDSSNNNKDDKNNINILENGSGISSKGGT